MQGKISETMRLDVIIEEKGGKNRSQVLDFGQLLRFGKTRQKLLRKRREELPE